MSMSGPATFLACFPILFLHIYVEKSRFLLFRPMVPGILVTVVYGGSLAKVQISHCQFPIPMLYRTY
jgi:hypothetical protein